MIKKLLDPRTRKYLYRVSLAVIAVLGVYGFISENEATYIIQLATAVFAIGVADANVYPTPEETIKKYEEGRHKEGVEVNIDEEIQRIIGEL